jgi:hypothetical protein
MYGTSWVPGQHSYGLRKRDAGDGEDISERLVHGEHATGYGTICESGHPPNYLRRLAGEFEGGIPNTSSGQRIGDDYSAFGA